MSLAILSQPEITELRAQPLTYPRGERAPDGYAAFTRTRRLAPSVDFAAAAQALLSWQVQSRAGLHVRASSLAVELDAVVVMRLGIGPAAIRIPCRVVDVVDEPGRRGFSYGTLPGHPESGEESFVVERAADGTISFTVAAFSRPASRLARVGGPLSARAQRFMTGRYLHALD